MKKYGFILLILCIVIVFTAAFDKIDKPAETPIAGFDIIAVARMV